MASHLGKEIELIKLATELPNARYSSSGNPSVIIEIDTNDSKKAAGVLFGNGKILVTGINTLEKGKEVIQNLRKIVKSVDSKVSMKRAIKLENMVVRSNLERNSRREVCFYCSSNYINTRSLCCHYYMNSCCSSPVSYTHLTLPTILLV